MTLRKALTLVPIALALAGTAALAQDPGDAALKRQLTGAEQVTQAHDYLTKMQDTQKRIIGLQDQAKKKKDVLKLNCVNDKLVLTKGHMAVADQSMTALNTAASRGDDGARSHEYTRLTILYQKVIVLGTEAENCIGEDVSYVGATKVDVDVDPSVPSDDPTEPKIPLPDPSRPPEATPFA
ncbi:MAG TPA: hypothetical protein VFF06_14860 [Polyangia bacterium]|nr:hypothetical protein [Polyangia bacterium]